MKSTPRGDSAPPPPTLPPAPRRGASEERAEMAWRSRAFSARRSSAVTRRTSICSSFRLLDAAAESRLRCLLGEGQLQKVRGQRRMAKNVTNNLFEKRTALLISNVACSSFGRPSAPSCLESADGRRVAHRPHPRPTNFHRFPVHGVSSSVHVCSSGESGHLRCSF